MHQSQALELSGRFSVKVDHENHYFRYAPLYKNHINSEIFLFLADFAFRQYFHSHFGSFRISAVFAFRQFSYLSSCRISAVSKGKNKKLLKYENCRNANKSETAEMRKLLKCDDIGFQLSDCHSQYGNRIQKRK